MTVVRYLNRKCLNVALAMMTTWVVGACSVGDGGDPSHTDNALVDTNEDQSGSDLESDAGSSVSHEPDDRSTTDPDEPVSDDQGGCDPANPGLANCEGAFDPQTEEEQSRCRSTYRGTCFENEQLACACAGCDLSDCRIAESYPTQVFCDEPTPTCEGGFDPDDPGETRTCNVQTNGLCFEETTDACLCACGSSTCAILESYPMQVACD